MWKISELKGFLYTKFEIKDLGSLKYFLGIEVARHKNGILISQLKYTLDLLEETVKLGAKSADTQLNKTMDCIESREIMHDRRMY